MRKVNLQLVLGTCLGLFIINACVPKQETGIDIDIQEPFKKIAVLENSVEPDYTNKKYNILFIITDQETHFRDGELPENIELPARDKLKNSGMYFANHQISSNVCSPSRSSIFSGQHIVTSGIYDNLNFSYINDFDTAMPTMPHILNHEGYYSVYQGKWHLSKLMDTHREDTVPSEGLRKHMEAYGFNDYIGIGDVIGMTEGGFYNDHETIAKSKRWLRLKGAELNKEGQPWFMTVAMVNPHDIMFYNTDDLDETGQSNSSITDINRTQIHGEFAKQMDVKLSPTRNEDVMASDRPGAHKEFLLGKGLTNGEFPSTDERWVKYNNYYLNLIEESDKNIGVLLQELEDQGMIDNTIIIMTADHGELRGAHGLHGKGATAYAEQNHVPLIVYHPDYKAYGGQVISSITSHLDLLPTMIDAAEANSNYTQEAQLQLKGKSLLPLLAKGNASELNEVRDYTLYCYNMISFIDADFTKLAIDAAFKGEKLAKGTKPDFTKRGSIRSVTNGQYRFTRYHSPLNFNQPSTLDELFENNDVELFDLINDPYEKVNLALDKEKNGELLLQMNALLNQAINEEILVPDDGSFLNLATNWNMK